MRALSLALLCLGSVSFLGLEAAKPDLASDFKRRWSKWEQQQQQQRRRARRELPSAVPGGGAPEAEGPLLPSSPSKAFVRPPQEAKGEPRSPEEEEASESASESAGHVRVKRYQYHQYHQYQYRPAAPALSQMHPVRTGCRLGTCNTANLAHIIFHLTDKDKDSTPPANKLSPHGYGRRRRKRRRRRRR